MTPTRFEFELLQNQVDFLSNSFDWVVGGIGVATTLTVVLVGYYVKKSSTAEILQIRIDAESQAKSAIDQMYADVQQKIDTTYRNLEEMIESKAQDIANKMYIHVDAKHSEMEAIVHEFKNSAEGDIARFYAVTNSEKKFYAQSFNWWLQAAVCYSNNDTSDLRNVSVKGALRALEKIEEGDSLNIEVLWDKMSDNCSWIEDLSKKHPSEATILKDLMTLKAKLPKEKSKEPATPEN